LFLSFDGLSPPECKHPEAIWNCSHALWGNWKLILLIAPARLAGTGVCFCPLNFRVQPKKGWYTTLNKGKRLANPIGKPLLKTFSRFFSKRSAALSLA
jgi:hypothetical protein